MDIEKFLSSGLLEQYALGLTDEKESAEVEKYLSAYPELAQQVVDMQNALHDYAEQMKIPCRKPRPTIERLNEKTQPKNEKNQSGPRFSMLLAWAMISTGLGLFVYMQNLHLRHHNLSLSAQYQMIKERWEHDRHSNIASVHQLDFIHDEDTRQFWMVKKDCKQASAVIYWNPSEKRAILQMLDINKDARPSQASIWAVNDCNTKMLADLKLESPYIYDIPFFSKCQQLVLSRTLPDGNSSLQDSITYSNNIY